MEKNKRMNNIPLSPFSEDHLNITGARENNLKNISLSLPQQKLIVITGLSGSGKSSLAFDTIYAEGQRRYMETFSAYARQFIGNLEHPDVDKITGLNPVIAIEQKTVNKNPRSTVGTITEIYDFLRLLYARCATAYSYVTGEKMVSYHERELFDIISSNYKSKTVALLAPVIRGRKGHYKEWFENIRKKGFTKARVDGEIVSLSFNLQLDRYKIHDIDIVIDQFEVKDSAAQRLVNSLRLGLQHGKGTIVVLNPATGETRNLSRHLICPTSGVSYQEPEPNTFSFNSPYGACTKCSGLGYITEIDLEKIIPDKKRSINEGGIALLGSAKSSSMFKQLNALAEKFNFSLNEPICNLGEDILDIILYGTNEPIYIKSEITGLSPQKVNFDGIVNFMNNFDFDSAPSSLKKWINQFINAIECPVCKGARLKKESLCFKIGDKTISDLALMDISDLVLWVASCNQYFDEKQQIIAHEIVREIAMRLRFLTDVGISYLSLNRSAKSLAGGEAQRIRLATQISSQLVNVLYILDEPSIGLHQRDNRRLIESLQHLRDAENSIIVVEHDEEMMRAADFIVDVGPFAGEHGGEIVAQGTFDDILKSNSLTSDYLTGKKQIVIPETRRPGNGNYITLINASGNNLKNITIDFPLGKLICVTGVSGSGKSSLVNETLYPILNRHIYKSEKKPLPYKEIIGLEHIDKVIEINQQPIGKTPRSNPATYIGVFDDIRQLFAQLPESKIRGYKPGRFSFNVPGGRCEECGGAGVKAIEMNFLPDVYVTCEKCNGNRYNAETLEIRYKGKSINDVLEMDIDTALTFFEGIPFIVQKLQTLAEVGLGYIRLGQPSTTLSGGEAQRVKLAAELSKKDTGSTFYILDEPTTGLHFHDIAILLDLLNRFVDKGNTVLIIEHNMDVIKMADHIIDMGPEGGRYGGEIIAVGTPEEVVVQQKGFTWEYLQKPVSASASASYSLS